MYFFLNDYITAKMILRIRVRGALPESRNHICDFEWEKNEKPNRIPSRLTLCENFETSLRLGKLGGVRDVVWKEIIF